MNRSNVTIGLCYLLTQNFGEPRDTPYTWGKPIDLGSVLILEHLISQVSEELRRLTDRAEPGSGIACPDKDGVSNFVASFLKTFKSPCNANIENPSPVNKWNILVSTSGSREKEEDIGHAKKPNESNTTLKALELIKPRLAGNCEDTASTVPLEASKPQVANQGETKNLERKAAKVTQT
jgi:hypothetical protein